MNISKKNKRDPVEPVARPEGVSRPRVFVAGGGDPYTDTRNVLSGFDLTPFRGKRVLIKPNAGRIAGPGSGIVTDPRVVAAVIDEFGEIGARPAVGESPIIGVRTEEAFEASGIARVARERNCPLIDFDSGPYVDIEVPEGEAIDSLRVCLPVLEYDLVVSVPVMKTHMHTGVTLSVKNMKGCLWRRSKVKLHMLPPVPGSEEKSINVAIADLAGVLRPQLAVIDGTVGMEGLGPSAGDPRPLGVVAASADAFAADAVACRLMGIDPKDIPHLRIGAERRYGVIDPSQMTVDPPGWEKWIRPFIPPPEDLAIEFEGVEILDENSCSACQSTLLLFLKRYGDTLGDYLGPDGKAVMAIGRGHQQLPEGVICVGNCTSPHRERGIFIPGCPPVASQILAALTGKPSIDGKDGRI